MATLRDTISADAPSLFVSGDVSAIQPGFRFRLDDELLDLSYFEKYPNIAGRRQKGLDHTHWAVARGVGGSTKSSHTAGATLKAAVSALVNSETVTPPIPFAGEGGAAEAGTVVVTLTGTETTYAHIYRGDEDPAVVFGAELEPGDLWIDTSFGPPYSHKERNATNDGWQVAASYVYTGTGNLSSVIQASEGQVTAETYDEATGFQVLSRMLLEAGGSGEGRVTLFAYDSNGDVIGRLLMNNGDNHQLTLTGGDPLNTKSVVLDETGLMLDADVIGTQAAAVVDAASDDPADIFATLNELLAALRASKELAT